MHWLDPNYLPEVAGIVDRYLFNPHADADGLLLTDGTEVHFPPHMSSAMLKAIHKGDAIKVRGVRPRATAMIAAVAIEAADGTWIVDEGPAKHHQRREDHKHTPQAKHKAMQAEGSVARVLHGPKGEVRGALLADGQLVRLPAHDAEGLAHLLSAGVRLAVRGEGFATEFGSVIEAREVGPSHDRLQPLKPKKAKRPEHDDASKPKQSKHAKGDDRARAD